MKHRAFTAMLGLMALLLIGCSQRQARDEPFTAASPNGLLVMGVTYPPEKAESVTIYFWTYDDATHVATAKKFPNPLLAKDMDTGSRYLVGQLPPGRYLIGYISGRGWRTWFRPGSVAFDIVAGQAAYIGDFEASRTKMRVIGADLGRARAELATYPLVSAPINRAPLSSVGHFCVVSEFSSATPNPC